jgi:hypothetical protein
MLAITSAWAEGKTEARDPTKRIPIIKVGDTATLDFWGFGQGAFVEDAEPDEFQWTNLRLYGNLEGKQLGLGFVLNFADLQEPEGNWLRELYGKFKLTDTLETRAGLILTSVGNGEAFPGPPKNETVLFPRSLQFGQYGYGLQLRWKTDFWSVVADITGNTALPFDDPNKFKDLEFSGRVKRIFRNHERELGYLGGTVQLTKAVNRFGLDGQGQPTKTLTLRGGVFYSDYASEKQSNQLSGFGLAAYRPKSWFEVHTMIEGTKDFAKEYQDLQEKKDKQGNVIHDEWGNIIYEEVTRRTSDATEISWTNGVRFFGKDDHWSLTLDYKTVLEGQREDQISLRVHIPF